MLDGPSWRSWPVSLNAQQQISQNGAYRNLTAGHDKPAMSVVWHEAAYAPCRVQVSITAVRRTRYAQASFFSV